MKTRFNGYEKTNDDFLKEILVVCPTCNKQALVKAFGPNSKQVEVETKVTCTHCGYNKILLEKPKDKIHFNDGKIWEVRHFYMNTNIDPYFGLPLWLQKNFPEGLVWAYNLEHLGFLEKHIAAELRERTLDAILNRSIASRLPKWMTTAKNRGEILKTINQLKQK